MCKINTNKFYVKFFRSNIWISIFADINNFLTTFDEIKLFGLNTEGNIRNFWIITRKIMNMGNELSKMYIVIIDTFGNLFSVITVIYYMIQGGIIINLKLFSQKYYRTLIQMSTFFIKILSKKYCQKNIVKI